MAKVDWNTIGSAYVPTVSFKDPNKPILDVISHAGATVDAIFKDKRSLEEKNDAVLKQRNTSQIEMGLLSGDIRPEDLAGLKDTYMDSGVIAGTIDKMNTQQYNSDILAARTEANRMAKVYAEAAKGRDEQIRQDAIETAKREEERAAQKELLEYNYRMDVVQKQEKIDASTIAKNAIEIEKGEIDIFEHQSKQLGGKLTSTIQNNYADLDVGTLKALQRGGKNIYQNIANATGIPIEEIKGKLTGEDLSKFRKSVNEVINKKLLVPGQETASLKASAKTDPAALKSLLQSDADYANGEEAKFVDQFYDKARKINKGKADGVAQWFTKQGQQIAKAVYRSPNENALHRAETALINANEAKKEEKLSVEERLQLNKDIRRTEDFIKVMGGIVKGEVGSSLDFQDAKEVRAMKNAINQVDVEKVLGRVNINRVAKDVGKIAEQNRAEYINNLNLSPADEAKVKKILSDKN